MRIRDIPLGERQEIGRRLYEARLTPLTWLEAARIALGRPDLTNYSTTPLYPLAREFAWKTGRAWPPKVPNWREFPNAAERKAAKLAERKAAKGAHVKQRREELGIDQQTFASRFTGLSVAELQRVELEGPDDDADYQALLHGLDVMAEEIEDSTPLRDWLILSDDPALSTATA